MIVLLAAGVGVCVLGLLAIGFGIPISNTSFGNALLIAGVVILCTGLILVGMWLVARELGRLMKLAVVQGAHPPGTTASPKPAGPANEFADAMDNLVSGRTSDSSGAPASSPPWAEEVTARARPRPSAHEIPPIEPVAAPPPPAAPDRPARRNLLFSTKRRDRAERESAAPSPSAREAEARVSFENAWPNPTRPNGMTERSERPTGPAEADSHAADTDRSAPPHDDTPAEAEAAQQARTDLPPGVTVVRSGTVDEMVYTYYSDGSIEAQLSGENPIRFASLDALRAYVEQRK
jgi:type IV secretory pathway VirB10-like protein